MTATDKNVPALMADLTHEVTTLIHQEIELAKAEMAEKGKKAELGVGMFGAAGLFAIFALGCLTAAAVAALQLVMPLWVAALIVAAAYGLVAGGLAVGGKHEIAEATPPVPEQAVESAKGDVAWLKSQARSATR